MSGLDFPDHVRLDARKINRLSGGLSVEITGILALNSSRHPSESWGPAFCLHVLQQKRDASFRWHDGENWEVISTDRPPL
jgi:hypothetical protein